MRRISSTRRMRTSRTISREPGQAAQHDRLDRRSVAAPPRTGRAAVRGVELRQPAGQRLGPASRTGRLRASATTRTSRAGSKPKWSARARWSTASRRRPTTRCASGRRRSPGVLDEWPIQREPFTQWVVEDLPVMRDADWHSVGVTLAKDVSVYDRAKLRLLNGPHSTLAYLGLLRGHESVADAMRDEQLAQFVELLMTEDLAPSLGATPGFDVEHYISAVLARFRNPGIRHLLEPDRLGRLEEAAGAHRGHDRRSVARRPADPPARDADRGLDAFRRAAGQGRRRDRRSGCGAPRPRSATPAPERRGRTSRDSRYANRCCRRR